MQNMKNDFHSLQNNCNPFAIIIWSNPVVLKCMFDMQGNRGERVPMKCNRNCQMQPSCLGLNILSEGQTPKKLTVFTHKQAWCSPN